MFYFWTFFFFFLRLSFRLYSLWVQCTRCSFGCNIRLFLASVYQYTALVCSLFCPLCIEQYQSVWACVWVSECVCVSPLQERSQILLQFSHFSIYLQWLSLCNSECIFVHWIWIYIYIYIWLYMYETWKWLGFIVLTTLVAVEMIWICVVGGNLTQLCTMSVRGEVRGGLFQACFYFYFWNRNPAACPQSLTQSILS